ncbi:MAG TPA: cupredoxin domain-containing protein [Candidatus Dormibacteraeota bacterium]|nr:cupredoxin domain-containing protein [Candidatus Dormibacteraeota bacterium]
MVKKSLNRRSWLFLPALVALWLGAFWLVNRVPSSGCAAGTVSAHNKEHRIVFQSGKVAPSCTRLTAGESVTWVNQTNKEVEIGADPHPVHTGNHEVSSGEFVLRILPGQSAKVIIKKKGSFGFHDHANPSAHGTIIVK